MGKWSIRMDFDNIIAEKEGPIAVITLNRPQQLNALSYDLVKDLSLAMQALDQDDQVRVMIVTGGEKVFAAGADIKEMADRGPFDERIQERLKYRDRINKISKPVIAAVSGFALGGGCELAMSCDIIIASETARLGQPEVNLGIIPGAGGTQRLTRAVGKYRAMDIILTGRRVKADEAKAIGLAAQVYPASSWLDDAKTLARTIADKPPIAIRLATEAVDLAWNSTLDAGLEFERKAFYLLFSTEDKKEGVDAFVIKRKAVFKGR